MEKVLCLEALKNGPSEQESLPFSPITLPRQFSASKIAFRMGGATVSLFQFFFKGNDPSHLLKLAVCFLLIIISIATRKILTTGSIYLVPLIKILAKRKGELP